ncbi:MAG TPA: hypothetical protein VJS68_02875 [Thermoplasmata archaeon]|nr:hypothetical protein [Thermoplasmata archaeon]
MAIAGQRSDYCWIEVRDPEESPSPLEPSESGEIPADRLTLVQPETLRPRLDSVSMPLWAAVADDPAGNELAQLTDFLKLPQLIQEALHRRPQHPFEMMVVANADRIEQFYAVDPMLIRAFFNLFRKLEVSVLVTSPPTERVDSTLFDLLLRIVEDPLRIRVEKGEAPWSSGAEIPIQLTSLRRASPA